MKFAALVIFLLCGYMAFSQSDEDATLNSKAVALMDNKQYKEALPYLDDLIRLNTQNPLFRHNRAVTLSNLERHREAIADYKILAKALPNESEYVFQIGNAYEQLDSAIQAIWFYSKAIELEKNKFLFYFKRGTIYLKQNNFIQAEADFDASLKLNPDHDNSLHNRGIALYKLGHQRKACEDWCRAYLLGNTVSLSHLEKNCPRFAPCIPLK
jgi:tetratricopeptide (TPR) repeat protein